MRGSIHVYRDRQFVGVKFEDGVFPFGGTEAARGVIGAADGLFRRAVPVAVHLAVGVQILMQDDGVLAERHLIDEDGCGVACDRDCNQPEHLFCFLGGEVRFVVVDAAAQFALVFFDAGDFNDQSADGRRGLSQRLGGSGATQGQQRQREDKDARMIHE